MNELLVQIQQLGPTSLGSCLDLHVMSPSNRGERNYIVQNISLIRLIKKYTSCRGHNRLNSSKHFSLSLSSSPYAVSQMNCAQKMNKLTTGMSWTYWGG